MLENLTPKKKEISCKVRTILNNLESDADKVILQNALDSVEWTNSGLTKALNEKGITISRYVVTFHREKRCSCWRI